MMRHINRLRDQRRAVANRDGSPVFPHSFGELATSGGREYIEIRDTFPAARKWEPLDMVVLINLSSVALALEINGLASGTLPPNSSKKITDQAFWGFAVTNNDATTTVTSGQVRAEFQREPLSADKVARGVS